MFKFLRSLLAGGRVGGPAAVAAVAEFQRFERELQQDFFALAARSGKPRGLRWMSCEWPQELLIVVALDAAGEVGGWGGDGAYFLGAVCTGEVVGGRGHGFFGGSTDLRGMSVALGLGF